MFDQEIWMELRALHHQGWSIAALGREFNLNRRTIARYVAADPAPSYGKRPCPAELSHEQLAYVVRRLEVCDKLRATTLYREVTETLGYSGSYVSFARRVRALRPKAPDEPEVRFETDPGVQVQVDWTELGCWQLGSDVVELKALVAVLGFSRMVALRLATDKTRATTLALVPQLLADLGGAPKEVLTDRDPVFVIGETSDRRAIFAPGWVDLALSLATTPRACRPYRAKTKGKVERAIQEIKGDLLPWLTGQPLPPRPTIGDYEVLARRWAHEVVATRRHRTTGRVVGDAWNEEKQVLRALPPRLIASLAGREVAQSNVVELAHLKAQGERVEARDLALYEAVLR